MGLVWFVQLFGGVAAVFAVYVGCVVCCFFSSLLYVFVCLYGRLCGLCMASYIWMFGLIMVLVVPG